MPPLTGRDIVQHQILAVLADRQGERPRLRFKGGTLLRACWAENYRYSEDLDFDWVGTPGALAKQSVTRYMGQLMPQPERPVRRVLRRS
ncbi:MAG: nucleotidyl transferase AbiEii/AbiGii toxin family protein [Gemmatimonadota bacterium]|nr:nucleotidyl transferase AbiEii/AbiGii toxin family protein [Gemmatimonadota bacterium]